MCAHACTCVVLERLVGRGRGEKLTFEKHSESGKGDQQETSGKGYSR